MSRCVYLLVFSQTYIYSGRYLIESEKAFGKLVCSVNLLLFPYVGVSVSTDTYSHIWLSICLGQLKDNTKQKQRSRHPSLLNVGFNMSLSFKGECLGGVLQVG